MKPVGWRRETDRHRQLFDRVSKLDNGCWEFTGYRSKKGYGEIKVDGRMEKTHRQAWLLTFGAIPLSLQVLHRCDNPPCINPSHLFLGTNKDNVADRVAKNRSGAPQGEQVWSAKLSADAVRTIRHLHGLGWSNRAITAVVPVNDRSISNIVTGKTWRHVA